MTLLPDNLGATLADELLKQSERDASVTPMDAVLDAAQSGTFTDDHGFRFLARPVDAQAHDVLRLRRLGQGN